LTAVQHVHPPITAVRDAVARALAEDLVPLGDVTSALLDPALVATAQIAARVDGVLAGRMCADEVFRQVDEALKVSWSMDDGGRLSAGDAIATVTGSLASMLTAERTALNFLGHLSGIATLTDRFVEAVRQVDGTLKVWDTRKTTPGLRTLEKAAVRAGGGANHRGNLSEWVMLKDNHLALMPIASAVAAARARWPGKTVQVECSDIGMVRDAVAADADIVMLDNMTPDQVAAAVAEVRATHPVPRPLLEISGRVDLDTIAGYATTGADLVSVGALTHSAAVLDIGLDVVG
jgi:nicotinate-nucleotide pyrophosphorylase (carboxylating)